MTFRPGLPELPLIGDACRVRGGFYTALVTCNCETHEPLLIPQGAIVQCPSCHRSFTLDGLRPSRQGMEVAIRVASPTPEGVS